MTWAASAEEEDFLWSQPPPRRTRLDASVSAVDNISLLVRCLSSDEVSPVDELLMFADEKLPKALSTPVVDGVAANPSTWCDLCSPKADDDDDDDDDEAAEAAAAAEDEDEDKADEDEDEEDEEELTVVVAVVFDAATPPDEKNPPGPNTCVIDLDPIELVPGCRFSSVRRGLTLKDSLNSCGSWASPPRYGRRRPKRPCLLFLPALKKGPFRPL